MSATPDFTIAFAADDAENFDLPENDTDVLVSITNASQVTHRRVDALVVVVDASEGQGLHQMAQPTKWFADAQFYRPDTLRVLSAVVKTGPPPGAGNDWTDVQTAAVAEVRAAFSDLLFFQNGGTDMINTIVRTLQRRRAFRSSPYGVSTLRCDNYSAMVAASERAHAEHYGALMLPYTTYIEQDSALATADTLMPPPLFRAPRAEQRNLPRSPRLAIEEASDAIGFLGVFSVPDVYDFDRLPSVKNAISARARGADIVLLQACALGRSPWLYACRSRAAHRKTLALADASATPTLATTAEYAFDDGDIKLGEGAFGCVFRAKQTTDATASFALKATFFQEGTGSDRTQSEINDLRLEIAFPALLSSACRHATPYLPDGTYGYIADTIGDAFGAQLRAHCQGLIDRITGATSDPLPRGLAVSALPIFDVGDFESLGALDVAVDSAAFQLAHQLLAFSTVAGFAHLDIKGGNIFVRSRRTTPGAAVAGDGTPISTELPAFRLRVLVRTADGSIRDRVFVDASPHIAMFGDFGLSAMARAPSFSLSANRGLTQAELHTLVGTNAFADPTTAMFYDSHDLVGTESKLLRGARERGFAADIWALGLSLLALLVRHVPTANPDGVLYEHHTIPAIKAESQAITKLIRAISNVGSESDSADRTGASKADREQTWTHRNVKPTKPNEGVYYGRVFVHALLLHKAFAGEWPDRELGDGPHWKYAMDTAQLDSLERESRAHWASVTKTAPAQNTHTPYTFIVAQIRQVGAFVGGRPATGDAPPSTITSAYDVIDFFARCFTFDPEARAAFFRSGEVFAHPFIAAAVTAEDTADTSSGTKGEAWTHALDLLEEFS